MISARGSSFVCNSSSAVSSSRREPLVLTITGSTTMRSTIFTASGRISVKTQSNCSFKNFGVTFMIEVTPVVFCATRAVRILIPYTSCAIKVFKSACAPAPPVGSVPAIVTTVFMFILLSNHPATGRLHRPACRFLSSALYWLHHIPLSRESHASSMSERHAVHPLQTSFLPYPYAAWQA